MRCKGTTKDGSRCKREAQEESDYCYQHKPSNKENRRKSKDARKIKAAEMLADPTVSSKREVYETLNIPESTFYDWMNKQEFIDMINEKIDKYTDRELAEVWKSLIKEAKMGDTRAIKLFFELKGKYKQEIDIGVKELPTINLVRGSGE